MMASNRQFLENSTNPHQYNFASITLSPAGDTWVWYADTMAKLATKVKGQIDEGYNAFIVDLATKEVRMLFWWGQKMSRYQVFTEELGSIDSYLPNFNSLVMEVDK